MQSDLSIIRRTLLNVVLGLAAAVVGNGCQSPGGEAHMTPEPDQNDPRLAESDEGSDADRSADGRAAPDAVSAMIADQAARLSARSGYAPDPIFLEPGTATPPSAETRGPVKTARANEPARPIDRAAANLGADASLSADELMAEADAGSMPVAAGADTASATRRELIDALLGRLRQEEGTAMSRAVTAAVVSLADPNPRLDPRLLAALPPDQRAAVQEFHAAIAAMRDELEAGGRLERDALVSRLDGLFAEEPIRIERLALCRRVESFGVYEPLDVSAFLAHQRNPMIVYVELDHFRSVPVSDDEYEVRLQQEIVLFNEADGLAVWRDDPVEIVDRSRNRRRDFFVRDLITLPARLGVGKYRLKVRISDVHAGTIDEKTMPIRLVADPGLIRTVRADDEPPRAANESRPILPR